jgi:hypothetical protein
MDNELKEFIEEEIAFLERNRTCFIDDCIIGVRIKDLKNKIEP